MTDESAEGLNGLMALLNELRSLVPTGNLTTTMMLALTIPDICGALNAPNGRATPPRYKKWFAENVRDVDDGSPDMPTIDWPGLVYGLRCSMLHQGRQTHGEARIGFVDPSSGVSIHWSSGHNIGSELGTFYLLAVDRFVDEVTIAAAAWLSEHASREPVKTNLAKSARYRPNGLAPVVVGVPVYI